jgi:regulation of enolase protein 1 (concanavalin A-like superfamily)
MAATWTKLTNSAPSGVEAMTLLSNGDVLAQVNGSAGWELLTPSSTGSYVNGTWSRLSNAPDSRTYYSTQMLPNGNVYIAGGEYGTGGATGAIYNPVTNSWTPIPTGVGSYIDAGSEILNNGNVLEAPVYPATSGYTYIYNPTTNTWSTGAKLYRGSDADEQNWVKLADGSILSPDGKYTSERYIQSSNTWVNDGTDAIAQNDSLGEFGTGALLPNGKVIYFGTGSTTQIYTPSGYNSTTGIYSPSGSTAGTWSAGPTLPGTLGEDDAPIAVQPDGNVLFTIGPIDSYNGPTSFYIYNYSTNTVALSSGAPTETDPPYVNRFLDLPDGTTLMSVDGTSLYDYNDGGTTLTAPTPTISSIVHNTDGSYTITGTQFTGNSEGAYYGDDAQMDSNYPIVRLTSSTGTVYFGRTYNWSTTNVDTGSTPVTTNFTIPLGLPAGTYTLTVMVNGFISAGSTFVNPVTTDVTPTIATAAAASPTTITGLTTSLSVLGASANGESTLTYNWVTTSAPSGDSTPSFSINGTNASKNTTATFQQAGTYKFDVIITDADGLSVTSSVITVVVSQVLTKVTVSPTPANLTAGQTQQLTATGYDQFGNSMSTQPTFTWSVSGGGTVSASGLYTTPSSGTLATVTATTGSLSATATMYVVSSPWVSADIGGPAITGSAYDSSGTFTVAGSGNDTWSTADEFHYVYQPIGGNGNISAEVVTQTDSEYYAKAGVMIRATSDTASIDAWIAITPSEGVQFGARNKAGGSTAGPTSSGPVAPYWVKLVRNGTTISGYYSANGTSWTLESSATINVTGSMDIGLFVCAVTNSTLCTATFSHVSLMLAAPETLTVSAGASGTVNVLTGDTGPSGATLTVTGVTQGSKGTVINNGNGTVTYTASANATGPDSFVYTISDGLGDTATGTVTVTILGLQAYYRFNEGTGTTTADSSGDGYTATISGATWTTGVDGSNGLAFSGTSQYVTTPAMDLDTNTVTLTGWIKSSGSEALSAGLIYERDGSNGNGLTYNNSTTLGYSWGTSASTYDFNTGLKPTVGTWTFVALVITASGATFYMQPLGGTMSTVSQSISLPVEALSSAFGIGEDPSYTTREFSGSMDEVRIYNVALSASAVAAIANLAPTVATAASATPSPVTTTTTALSVLGADYAGQSVLTYTWAATTLPAGATAPTFSANGTNAAQNTTATFSHAGNYVFTVTIADGGGLSTTSTVSVTVNQTITSINVSPASVNLAENANQTFTAVAYDQFGNILTTQPTFTWSKSAGVGSINSSTGVYTSPAASGSATLLATSGAISGSASVAVNHTGPTVATAASASPSPATTTSVALSVLGADEDGESTLTYLWAATTVPAGAVVNFVTNNTNAAKNTTATFNKAGSYTFQVTITDDQNSSITSSVTVNVLQTLTSISVAATTVAGNATTQASAVDQFGNAISTSAISWSVNGGGSINPNGLFTANQSGGSYTITGRLGTAVLTTGVTVVPTSYTGVAGGETYAIRISPNNPALEQIFVNTPETASPTYTISLSLLTTLSFASSGTDGGLTIDFANGSPLPSTGVSDAGGGGVFIKGAPAGGMGFTVDGSRIIDSAAPSSAIAYSNIQQIELDLVGGSNLLTQTAQPGALVAYNAGTGNNTLNISGGSFTLTGNPQTSSGSLTVNDNSALVFTTPAAGSGYNVLNLQSLKLDTNATATLQSGAAASDRLVLAANTLSVAAGATLDLGSNDMILHNENEQTLSGLLQSGYNSGGAIWGGTGITSSTAAADASHLTALGEMSNNYHGSAIYSTFDGQAAVASDVLVKFTYVGDANLDGQVDGSDYTKVDNGFNNQLSGWSNGDFNYDGIVNGSDYTLIDNAFNTQSTPISSSPPPGSTAPTQPPTSTASTPLAYYKFNSVVASTTSDSSGNGYTAVVNDATTATGVDGTEGLFFNGTSSYATIPATSLNSNAVTLSAWIERNGNQTAGAGIIFNGTAAKGYGLKFGTANQLDFAWGTATDTNSGLVVPDGQWTFVAVVVTPTTATLYMQPMGGSMQSVTQTVTNAVHAFNTPTYLGADVSGKKFFHGTMDEVQINPSALTSAGILALENLAPEITSPAAALLSPNAALTINLLVQATSQAGAANLTYTWSIASGPAGAMATYLVNGSATSNATTVVVSVPGTYTFRVTVTDPGHMSTTSTAAVQIDNYPADIGDVYYDAPVDGSGIVPLDLGNVLLHTRVPVLIYTAPNPTDRWVVIADSFTLTDPNAQFDLGGNDMIIHDSGSLTPRQLLAQITGYIQSGFALGSGYPWTGTGLASAAAASDSAGLTGLGVMLNMNAQGNAIYNTWDGQKVSATDVLVKYTSVGDANLDGRVDGSDFSLIDHGFADHLTGWANGDFNYDGVVNASDYQSIDAAYNAKPDELVGLSTAQFAASTAMAATGSSVFLAPQDANQASAIVDLLRQKLAAAGR